MVVRTVLKKQKAISNTRRDTQLRQRRQRALELRMAGASYAQIVKANIGYSSLSHVSNDMKKILESAVLDTPEELIMLDLARLDDLQQVLTLHFHKGNVSLSGPIMQVMKFRHELLGIDAESIRQRRLERTQVTNNGIMVVQGTGKDYLAGLMDAAGLSEEQKAQELRKLESRELKELPPATGEVIQGEIVPEPVQESIPSETTSSNPSQNPSESTSDNPNKKSVSKISSKTPAKGVRLKVAPGKNPKKTSKATGATETRSKGQGAVLGPRDLDKSLEDRLVAFSEASEAKDRAQEAAVLPQVRLAEAIVTVDLDDPQVQESLRRTIRERVLERDIKSPDNNHPVSPGVPYKAAPRKLSPQEGREVVLRKLRKPGATEGRLVDRVPVETREEEIP